jgi:hypothetical protein
MNYKFELKITDKEKKFSSSSMRIIKVDTLFEVIQMMLIETGSVLYALNPYTNKDALVLTETSTFKMLEQLLEQKEE